MASGRDIRSGAAEAGFDLGAMGPVIDSMTKVGTSLGDAYAAVGQEWMTFVGHRLQEDFLLPQRLAACASPQDVVKAWSDFFRVAAEAYQAEWGRLAELGSANFRDFDSAVAHADPELRARRDQD